MKEIKVLICSTCNKIAEFQDKEEGPTFNVRCPCGSDKFITFSVPEEIVPENAMRM